ncbi:scavenger receptor cysteine-rich domain-containing protein DMBT1-like [Oryzias latipes]
MFTKKQQNSQFLTLAHLPQPFCDVFEGQIRLVGSGSTRCSGRVEVYHNGIWGTVCDDDWDLKDAKVICRQLSCGPVLQAPGSAHFGQGSDKIWLDNVACSGSESSLTQCGHNGYGKHNCNHGEDAGVICSGQIRLVGSGSTRCSGRVEVQHRGSWGTVCDDEWDLNDANVVCRQLSCGTALHAPGSAHFGQGSGTIWLDNVACYGSESSLTECGHNDYGEHNCNHGEDAGVICSGESLYYFLFRISARPKITVTSVSICFNQTSHRKSCKAQHLHGSCWRGLLGSGTQNHLFHCS